MVCVRRKCFLKIYYIYDKSLSLPPNSGIIFRSLSKASLSTSSSPDGCPGLGDGARVSCDPGEKSGFDLGGKSGSDLAGKSGLKVVGESGTLGGKSSSDLGGKSGFNQGGKLGSSGEGVGPDS